MTDTSMPGGPNAVSKGLMWLFAVVVGLMGVIFVGGGIYLLTLGGSLYYVVGGAIFVAAAVLLFRGHRTGAWLFGAGLALTIIWAL